MTARILFDKAYNCYNNNDYTGACKYYSKLIKITEHESVYRNYALALMSVGQYKKALTYLKLSDKLLPDDNKKFEQSLCYLHIGDINNASEYYKYRYTIGKKNNNFTGVTFDELDIPNIKYIDDKSNSTILVIGEQGLGDYLLFTSFIPKHQHDKIKLVVRDSIYTLFEIIFPTIKLIKESEFDVTNTYGCDCWMALGDLFINNYDTNKSISLNLHQYNYSRNIGICWSTNAISPNSNQRSIDRKIFNVLDKDYNLISLQYGSDFNPSNALDTWNKLDELDLVITVDTFLAHLAGIKGIPTILIINEYHDWRWKNIDSDSFSLTYNSIEVLKIQEINKLNRIVNDYLT